jgi:lactoylglutathione lyase
MPKITQVGRTLVPVADQDQAIEFYTKKLGFTVVADVAFGERDRWVEVSPAAAVRPLRWCHPRASTSRDG